MKYHNFLAPLFDYSDLPFRILCQRYGADACCAPMANSMAIERDPKKLSEVDAHPDEKNIGVQVIGGDPKKVGKACMLIADSMSHVKWLNLNAGCPSPRTMRCGGGSDMLLHPKKIFESVKLMRKADLPVSVKIRVSNGVDGTLDLCRKIEAEGADSVIIHGRTVKQGYSGKSDWELIRHVKEGLDIPVVGNGDIQSASEGRRLVREGYCDSFMVGRAAMSNPLLFKDQKPQTIGGMFCLLEEYICLCSKYYEKMPIVPIRLKAMNFIRGARSAARLRNSISNAKSVEEILEIKKKESAKN
ncbi:MAG: tRNA-dihydrouridine synthase family protein [Candidatus Micrarchaeota archaeon]